MLKLQYRPEIIDEDIDGADLSESDPYVYAPDLTAEQRRDLKARIESGDVQSIRAWVKMFGDEPNMHGIRPKPGRLGEFSGSRPLSFVKDHAHSVDAIIGRVEDRKTRAREDDGVEQLLGLHRITDPKAMRAYVDGDMLEFSVYLRAEGDLECSECGARALRGSFGGVAFACDCKGAELFMTGPVHLLHNAWVTEGAYRDTGATRDAAFHIVDPSTLQKEATMAQDTMTVEIKAEVIEPTPAPEKPAVSEAVFSQLTNDLEAADARIEQLEAQLFDARFELAVRERRVKPSQRSFYQGAIKVGGFDATLALMAGEAPREDLAATAVGADVSATAEHAPGAVVNPWAAAEAAVRRGVLKASTLEAAKRGEIKLTI